MLSSAVVTAPNVGRPITAHQDPACDAAAMSASSSDVAPTSPVAATTDPRRRLPRGRSERSWNNRLLDAGLLGLLLTTAEHFDQFRDDIGRQIPDHLAAIAVHGDNDPITAGWARTFTRTTDSETRTAWLERVGWIVAEMEADSVEHQWTRWMRQYWTDRLSSTPIALTDDEASTMAAWTVYLTDSVEEAVTLAQQHAAHIPPHSRFLDDLPERVDRAPPSSRLSSSAYSGTPSHRSTTPTNSRTWCKHCGLPSMSPRSSSSRCDSAAGRHQAGEAAPARAECRRPRRRGRPRRRRRPGRPAGRRRDTGRPAPWPLGRPMPSPTATKPPLRSDRRVGRLTDRSARGRRGRSCIWRSPRGAAWLFYPGGPEDPPGHECEPDRGGTSLLNEATA
jgi:hypothetical protein